MTTMARLVAERKRQKLTQALMAERLGVTQACVSRWESDVERAISLTDAEAYAAALGLPDLDVKPLTIQPVKGDTSIGLALNAFPEDDERHWQVQAYLFNLLAHKAASKADAIRQKAAAPSSPDTPKGAPNAA